MHAAMGNDPTPEWQQRCVADFTRRLATDTFVAFLVVQDGLEVACGVGWLEEHLPSPFQLDPRRGHVSSMSTHPDHRRQGHARVVLRALMDWFAEREIPRVDLRATPDGLALYESEGFKVLGGATMAWTRPGVRAGMGGDAERSPERDA
jgi:ribosomal protein S18 acetylase RimI-like enzyme